MGCALEHIIRSVHGRLWTDRALPRPLPLRPFRSPPFIVIVTPLGPHPAHGWEIWLVQSISYRLHSRRYRAGLTNLNSLPRLYQTLYKQDTLWETGCSPLILATVLWLSSNGSGWQVVDSCQPFHISSSFASWCGLVESLDVMDEMFWASSGNLQPGAFVARNS